MLCALFKISEQDWKFMLFPGKTMTPSQDDEFHFNRRSSYVQLSMRRHGPSQPQSLRIQQTDSNKIVDKAISRGGEGAVFNVEYGRNNVASFRVSPLVG